MSRWFDTCDTFCVVFLCEKTLTPIKYGKKDSLEFKVLKGGLGKAAKAFGSIWEKYGPLFDFAAAAITVALSVTTGLKLSLLPSSVIDIANDYTSVEGFISDWETLGSMAKSNAGLPW